MEPSEELEIKENLLENLEVLATTFKREEKEIRSTIESISGKREDLFNQFLVKLNLPLNVESLVVLSSLAKKPKTSFFDKISQGFKSLF